MRAESRKLAEKGGQVSWDDGRVWPPSGSYCSTASEWMQTMERAMVYARKLAASGIPGPYAHVVRLEEFAYAMVGSDCGEIRCVGYTTVEIAGENTE